MSVAALFFNAIETNEKLKQKIELKSKTRQPFLFIRLDVIFISNIRINSWGLSWPCLNLGSNLDTFYWTSEKTVHYSGGKWILKSVTCSLVSLSTLTLVVVSLLPTQPTVLVWGRPSPVALVVVSKLAGKASSEKTRTPIKVFLVTKWWCWNVN